MALAAALRTWDDPSTSNEGLRRYEEVSQALTVARAYLYPRDISGSNFSSRIAQTPVITAAFDLLLRQGRANELYKDFIDVVEDRFHLVKKDIQRCNRRLDDALSLSVQPQISQIMVELLDRLALWQRSWGLSLKVLNNSKLISSFTAVFHHLVHSSLPSSFPEHLRLFLLSDYSRLVEHDGGPIEIKAPSPHFSRLGIMPRYSGTLSRVAFEEIARIAREEADKGWDVRRLGKARQRVGEGVAGWLGAMFDGSDAAQQSLRPMFTRFDNHLCKCFFDIRTDELFDIIVDYPDSLSALEDLKECLFKVDKRSFLVDKLNASNVKRLLHPGAETKDVITQYISTIRCLRILDPPGVLLHKVAEPIRRHLRERPDTIKCIVAYLVEGEELQDENELSAGHGVIGQSGEDEAENFVDPKWDPEPVDAAPEFRSGKPSDVVSTLVSIYETREVIIKELQVLLATRLLAVKDYDAVKEIRTIELLKIRFGETALQGCDVMLKDMADSKRINDHVHGDINSVVHPLVISRMFWPNVQSSSLHLTPKLEAAQREYEAAFHHFKPDKHLRWLQGIGTVTIKLELEDRVVEVEATPLQASIMECFEENGQWTIEALSEKIGVSDEGVLRNALSWWAGHGVVREKGDVWHLLETKEEAQAVDVVEEEPAIHDIQMDRVMEISAHWKHIAASLTTLGPQTLEDIQRQLNRVNGYHNDIDELDVFMYTLKDRGNVDVRVDGKWVLVRSEL